MPKKAIYMSLVALGVGLMAFALLTGRSSLARWSIVPVAVVAVALGAKGLRKEPASLPMLVAGCAAAILAVAANLGLFGMHVVWANILGVLILFVMAAALLVPAARQRFKE